MKKNKLIAALLFVILFVSACGDAGKILRNEKLRGSDEFSVKIRGPLTTPPDMDKLPKPGTKSDKQNNNQSIKALLKTPKSTQSKNSKKSSSNEEEIINQIRN